MLPYPGRQQSHQRTDRQAHGSEENLRHSRQLWRETLHQIRCLQSFHASRGRRVCLGGDQPSGVRNNQAETAVTDNAREARHQIQHEQEGNRTHDKRSQHGQQ